MDTMKPDCKKIVQVVNYLIRKNGGDFVMPELKIIKLVWATDRYHLRKYARTVTYDEYVAMGKGPVGSSTKDVIEFETNYGRVNDKDIAYSERYINFNQNNSDSSITSVSETDFSELSKSDIEALDFALTNFGKMDTNELISFTHHYPEWKKHEVELRENSKVETIDLLDFFEDPSGIANDPFRMPDKMLKISKEIFAEYA